MNWRISPGSNILNLLNMAEGFLTAAIELAKDCLANNSDKKADILIFPILTNANHGVELYLKAISWTLIQLTGSDEKVSTHHNLKQLFATAKAQVGRYPGSLKVRDFNIALKGLEQYLDELFAKIEATPKDDKMDFSRYPFSTKQEAHFYVTRVGNVEVDLVNFVTRFEDIKLQLENVSDFLYHCELNRDW